MEYSNKKIYPDLNYSKSVPLNELSQKGKIFVEFIQERIGKKFKSKSIQSQYRAVIKHLNDFSLEQNMEIYTNSISEEFIGDFICHLEEKNLMSSTIKGIIEKVKAMVKKSAIYGYPIDPTFDDVLLKDEEIFATYLTLNEITRIYYFKGLTKYQEQIRDLFVVGCLTGLRYSDYSTLTKDNFRDDIIVKKTKKTGITVYVPIHDYVKNIFKKYNGEMPKYLSIQHFNRSLKEICKKIGFDEELSFTRTIGGKTVTKYCKRWELISSHTARRSAATNMYNSGRFTTMQIMMITGHTTEKNFFKYIQKNKEENALSLSNDIFFKK